MNRLFLGVCLLLALGAALPAQEAATLSARLAVLENVMERFYRGESLEAGRKRVGDLVDAYNARVTQRNADQERARAQLDRDLAPGKELEAELEAADRALGTPPSGGDREALRSYNARVEARNALADRYNQQLAVSRVAIDAYNDRLSHLDDGIDRDHARLKAEQQALKARVDAYAAWTANGQDVVFYTALNGLLAELRQALRRQADGEARAALDQVRGTRRELARWAAAYQATQDNGLVLVDAVVGDEVCYFILDTGAQLVCLPRELIDAMGLTGSLGEDTTLVLAGGQKIKGRSIAFPVVAAAGMEATAVAGSAVPASEVGIDGLLGQSFLKRFVYTIDESRPGKLVLVRR